MTTPASPMHVLPIMECSPRAMEANRSDVETTRKAIVQGPGLAAIRSDHTPPARPRKQKPRQIYLTGFLRFPALRLDRGHHPLVQFVDAPRMARHFRGHRWRPV